MHFMATQPAQYESADDEDGIGGHLSLKRARFETSSLYSPFGQ